MGTHEKQYSIKWLNFNPEAQKIEALYGAKAIFDDGEIAELKDKYAQIDGTAFLALFMLPITIMGKESTMGEALGYLTASAGKLLDPNFPIDPAQTEKFGNTGIELLGGAIPKSKVIEDKVQG
jgi:hypothetical protein